MYGGGDRTGEGGTSTTAQVSGFTLIELVVTIAILAIMVALAVPSFTALINSNRLAANSTELVASLQTAKMESIRRNMRVAVCESSNGSTCTDNDVWQQWITVADVDLDGNFDGSDEVLRVSRAEDAVQVRGSGTVTGNGNRIEFRADGLARAADNALLASDVAVCLPTTRPKTNQRRVNIRSGSHIGTLAPEDAAGVCIAP